MIQFNELKFLDCNNLKIDAQIPFLPTESNSSVGYLDNCYIDRILIDTQDTVCEGGPSTKAIEVKTYTNHPTRIIETINTSQFSNCATPKMLFVYVHMSGIPAPNTPCRWDDEYDMCAVANLAQVYQYAYKQIKCTKGCGCVGQDCAVDANFANFALQYFRLTTALDIKDWPTAYDAYLTLMRCRNKRRKTPSYKPCGCK